MSVYHTGRTVVDNEDGTHRTECTDCNSVISVEPHFTRCNGSTSSYCYLCDCFGRWESRHSYLNGICTFCGQREPASTVQNGLNPSDGYYYVNGEKALDFTGLVAYDGANFYVENGKLNTDVNGLKLVDGAFYYFAGGQVQVHHGFAEYDGEWFYLNGGQLDITATGIYEYDGAKFFIAAGRLVAEHVGLAQVPSGEWYYVADGRVLTEFTGEVTYDGTVFQIVNGKLVG